MSNGRPIKGTELAGLLVMGGLSLLATWTWGESATQQAYIGPGWENTAF